MPLRQGHELIVESVLGVAQLLVWPEILAEGLGIGGELGRVVEKYRNRELTAEDLEQARQDLTLLYINKGYVNSGAVLPDQDGRNGVITFQLVEGRLTDINLKGNFWFRPWWLRNEMRRGAGQPLNFNKLKEALQLLRQNPTISQINAELKPGGVPGESILDVDIKDTQPFRFAIEFDNFRFDLLSHREDI